MSSRPDPCGFVHAAGLIQPTLLEDGQVCVDMGLPVLNGPLVPTSLAPTRPDGAVVQQVRPAAAFTGTCRQSCVAARGSICATQRHECSVRRISSAGTKRQQETPGVTACH